MGGEEIKFVKHTEMSSASPFLSPDSKEQLFQFNYCSLGFLSHHIYHPATCLCLCLLAKYLMNHLTDFNEALSTQFRDCYHR